jgi:hypothetical protein
MSKEPKFDKPLNEWVDEEVPVPRHEFDPKTERVTTTYTLEKVRTKYMKVKKETLRCPRGEHIFKVVDRHRYHFKCVKCGFGRQVYPTFYKFTKEGKLVNRLTGEAV